MKHRKCMEGFFGQFLRESNLHGVKYIGLPDRHPCEKIFWLIAVLASVGISFFMVFQLYRKYNDNPVIISFQPKETRVAQIPFPALTLCNVNILKTQLVWEIVGRLSTELNNVDAASRSNATADLKRLKEAIQYSEHLAHYCLAAPSFRRLLNETLIDAVGERDYVQSVQDYISKYYDLDMQYFNLTMQNEEYFSNSSLMENGTLHVCEDMILKCMWAQKFIPCNQLFRRIYTQHGGCCVFNMMPKHILKNMPDTLDENADDIPEDEIAAWSKFKVENLIQSSDTNSNVTVPRYQKAGGKPYGLSILINPELGHYSTCNTNDANGFQLTAHSPISFPSIMEYGVAIPPESEVFIDIEPQLTTANEPDLKSIGLDKRSCYFPSDENAKLASYNFYSSSNCLDECMARLTYEKCKCVRFFMPRNSTQQLCGAKKLDCSENVRKNLTESTGIGEHCNECKPACTEIKYKLQVSHFPLQNNISTFMYSTSEEDNRTAYSYSIVHIFLGTDSLYAKERKRLYDAADLLANAGGLLSLTLGFSIISLIEILYFFTLRAWFQRKDDEAAESDEDSYSSSKNDEGCRKVFAKPRTMDGLTIQDKMTDYYNWAMAATTTNMINVKSSNQATIADSNPTSFSNKESSRRRIPAFQLLKGPSTQQFQYPYLS